MQKYVFSKIRFVDVHVFMIVSIVAREILTLLQMMFFKVNDYFYTAP